MKKIFGVIFVLILVLTFVSFGGAAVVNFAEGSIHTEDATPTEVVMFLPQDDASFIMSLQTIARQSNGTGRASLKQTFLVTRDGGVTTAVAAGAQEKLGNAGSASWVITPAIIDGYVVIRATGVAGQTIDWYNYITGYQVGPF